MSSFASSKFLVTLTLFQRWYAGKAQMPDPPGIVFPTFDLWLVDRCLAYHSSIVKVLIRQECQGLLAVFPANSHAHMQIASEVLEGGVAPVS
jgi:hypothetical protein